MSTLLEQTKTALRLRTNAPEITDEIETLIMAGINDLRHTAGVDIGQITSPAAYVGPLLDPYDVLVATAVKTYVKINFGEPDEYERLKRSYDEQKAQLKTARRQ